MQVLDQLQTKERLAPKASAQSGQRNRLVAQWHTVNGKLTCRWVREA